ncbi:MAG: hypothetical protein WB626_11445 [Bacteroidota bacterium]
MNGTFDWVVSGGILLGILLLFLLPCATDKHIGWTVFHRYTDASGVECDVESHPGSPRGRIAGIVLMAVGVVLLFLLVTGLGDRLVSWSSLSGTGRRVVGVLGIVLGVAMAFRGWNEYTCGKPGVRRVRKICSGHIS